MLPQAREICANSTSESRDRTATGSQPAGSGEKLIALADSLTVAAGPAQLNAPRLQAIAKHLGRMGAARGKRPSEVGSPRVYAATQSVRLRNAWMPESSASTA